MSKKYIKEEILNTARRLFNQRGYNEVSMRDIADALSISVGNLTYHYPRKEDLMEAVVLEMHRYYTPPTVPQSLPALNALFARLQNNVQQNAFYFWHYTQLAQLSPVIHDIQTKVLQDHHAMLLGALQLFESQGLVQPEAYKGHYTQLALAVKILCVYWEPHSHMSEGLPLPNDFLDCIWSVLIPVLTDEGREIYREKIQKVRIEIE
ncbi:TetR/AcrR family transcriptional regulator [Ruminococcaceae bacterium OttesenSCG-928-O06]|nr:TetR/AcrR family transcriptional regulator [Ruminococcaceae bacterium OttesenSCG-928-O06]